MFVSTQGGESRKLGAVQVELYARDAIDVLVRGAKNHADVTIQHLSGLVAEVGDSPFGENCLDKLARFVPNSPNMKTPIPQDAAIQEGQTAAQELINQGASAIAIALVDDKRIIWSQRFGLADRDTGQMPTDSTMFGVGSGAGCLRPSP